ncbi:MAG TPA: T9SS type A sorting domain-containing protein [Bacteroidia bacterium]|nr:T9SS type A sorting domain-containing protein [Bacteroidia bacterium]
MKKVLLLSAGMLVSIFIAAQKEIRHADGSYYKQCARFRITEPLSEIAAKYPAAKRYEGVIKEAADGRAPVVKSYNETFNPEASTVDGSLQSTDGTIENKGPLISINGAFSTLGYVPLDPNGMIGSNYYVQTINSNFEVFNKTGTIKLAEMDLTKLFGSFTCDDGDPVTMYDRFADRWIITEFQENAACNTFGDNIDTMMMAVSVTNDPTGSYYVYYFCPDNADFADYPKYSIWADGYYQTCNCSDPKVTVYERSKMLTGDPTAGFIVTPFSDAPGGNGGFFCAMTMYADGSLPPYGSPNYLMFYTDDNWGTGFTDALKIETVSVSWTTKIGTITPYQTLNTTPFDSYFSGGSRKDIDEPGKPGSFDALDGFVSYRIPYLRWGKFNSAVLCYPVNVSTTPTTIAGGGGTELAGVRWYEIRQDTTTKLWSIYQQGTYAPNDGVNRWNPSIAMDANGSIGLCYSVSDKTATYPGARYTGRTACDPLGTMTLTEGVGVNGTGGALNTTHRWGDYSHTSVDPKDGITFWHTNMYDEGGSVNSRIFTFKIPTPCPMGIEGINEPQVTLTAFQSGSILNVKAQGVITNNKLEVDIYDVLGKHVTGKAVSPGSNIVETTFNVTSLAKGIYYVRIGNDEFQRVVKVEIN